MWGGCLNLPSRQANYFDHLHGLNLSYPVKRNTSFECVHPYIVHYHDPNPNQMARLAFLSFPFGILVLSFPFGILECPFHLVFWITSPRARP